MIDVTVKSHVGGFRDLQERKSHTKNRRKKHDAINLPKNLSDSDDDGQDHYTSEDENDGYPQNELFLKGVGHQMTQGELSRSYLEMEINEKKIYMIEALRKLRAVVRRYKEDLFKVQFKDCDLKPRSPFRNRLDEHKKNKQYNELIKRDIPKKDLTTIIPHLSVGKVVVQNLTPVGRTEVVRNVPKDHELNSKELHDLVNAIQDVDFMASFKKLSEEEVEDVFNMFVGESGSQAYMHHSVCVKSQQTVSPDTSHSQRLTSPLNIDQYDSSYETESPSSTVVTSPGSPAALFSPPRTSVSPPRTSVSSESDQELEHHTENYKLQPQTNFLSVPAHQSLLRCSIIKPECIPKPEQVMKPLGEVVPFIKISATDRLLEFQNSNSFCIQHFSIQLVRVIMSAKGQKPSEKLEEFSKSLINTMKMKLSGKRAREEEIWQLSILAHVQFLLARVAEYRSALRVQDEHNHSLLYIAAIDQHQKPLVARYIAESMYKVGLDPLEQMDEKGNTILHLVAEQGDSHVHVLSELLMACDPKNVHNVNKALQTALHTAVCSSKPHLSTVLTLLKMRASPLQRDIRDMSALHYHIKQLVPRFPRPTEDVEVVRKMLQSLLSLNTESLPALNILSHDSSIPGDLKAVVLEEVGKYGIKDLRLRTTDKRIIFPNCK